MSIKNHVVKLVGLEYAREVMALPGWEGDEGWADGRKPPAQRDSNGGTGGRLAQDMAAAPVYGAGSQKVHGPNENAGVGGGGYKAAQDSPGAGAGGGEGKHPWVGREARLRTTGARFRIIEVDEEKGKVAVRAPDGTRIENTARDFVIRYLIVPQGAAPQIARRVSQQLAGENYGTTQTRPPGGQENEPFASLLGS